MFNPVAAYIELKKEIFNLRKRLNTLDHYDKNAPAKDENNNLQAIRSDPSFPGRVLSGRIVDSQPVIGWYKVQLDGQGNLLVCGLADSLSTTPVGPKRVGALSPGTRVFVIVAPSFTTGTIIGTSFGYDVGLRETTKDYISQASTNTIPSENILNKDNYSSEKLYSFNPHSPLDETSAGEWGMMAETGVALFVDSFMSYLRADENCGFWAFWHDQLARIHGHNLQIRSPACSMEFFDDEGELSGITGWAPYLWESLGGTYAGKKFFKERTPEEAQKKTPEFAQTDLANAGQTPFHRLIRYDGFLGQGFKQQLRLPPPSLVYNANIEDPNGLFSTTNPPATPVVWEEHLAMDGNYHMLSSQGVFIAHVPVRGSYLQQKRPDDATGDMHGVDSFYAAGLDEANKAKQKVREGMHGVLPDGTGAALLAEDELAYGTNWRGSHPFAYHKKDWKPGKPFSCEKIKQFGTLSEKQYLPRPDEEKLYVDARYGEGGGAGQNDGKATFHPTLSFLSILRDGTVVIAGPAGEEIRMAGGSIEITCPGDIQLRPGRNLISLSGRDTVLRSVEDLELSSAQKDVRIKADRNFQVLGGNSGTGGVMIESRGVAIDQDLVSKVGSDVDFSGITLKAKSFISSVATDIYIRAGLPDSIGSIVIDASKGTGTITANANTITNYVKAAVIDYFGEPGKVKAANYYTAATTVIAAGLQVLKGTASFGGGAIFQGNIAVGEGHIFTDKANTYKNMVPEFGPEGKQQLKKEKVRLGEVEKTAQKAGDAFYKAALTDRIYAEKRFGSDVVLKTTSFSFRTSKQCKAAEFMLFESRWAQKATAIGEATKKWKESQVLCNGEVTYPFPGREAWLTNKNYKKIPKTLYAYGNVEVEGGNSQGFGPLPTNSDNTVYTGAEVPKLQEEVLDNNYPVIY